MLDVEDAKGQQAGEGVGDVGGGVEDGETTGEFSTTVEGGQVVDDQGEKGGFGHAQEPAEREDAGEVECGGGEKRHGAKGEHEDGQHAGWVVFLAEHGERRCEYDIGHEEDGKQEVILALLEVEVLAEPISLSISKVPFVQRIEEVCTD